MMCRKSKTAFMLLVSSTVSSGWYCVSCLHLQRTISSPRTTRMTSSYPDIDVALKWPALSGKQTSANSAAGELIRGVWATETAQGRSATDGCVIRRDVVEYRDGDTLLQGLYAIPEGMGVPERLPGVIVAHTAVGPQEDFILWKLDSLARLGYAAFALDMFGTGRALWDRSESLAARRILTEDRSRMQGRAMAALETLSRLPGVDPGRIAAIGYCFGGMAVLDLARMGSPPGLRAVATLHGILTSIPANAEQGNDARNVPIAPKILVLHAAGDPFIPMEQVEAMREEFERRRADLEVVTYGGNARHAFTRPEKTGQENTEAGFSYDEDAERDSWRRVLDMLRDELA